MWNKIKKFLFKPSERDNERVERWKEETGSDDKLTIEHFDKAVNPKEEVEEVQVTKHMSIKQKKKKTKPVNYNF
tara:strand:+ start:18214 stop:18435 length:222 start_codon:yes stop_codon:yes gene_type:complete